MVDRSEVCCHLIHHSYCQSHCQLDPECKENKIITPLHTKSTHFINVNVKHLKNGLIAADIREI